MTRTPLKARSAARLTDDFMVLPFPSETQQRFIEARKYAKGGYAVPPGSGPADETCGSCKHLYRKEMSRAYLKCNLARARWTGGGGTDVKARAPACSKWEATKP